MRHFFLLDCISEIYNNAVTDLRDGCTVSVSHTHNWKIPGTLTATRSPSRCSVRVPRHSLVSTELFVLWLSADSSFKLWAFYRITVTRKQLAVRWEPCPFAVSVCRRLVLGGVTALTNEAGCMVEHHLRPANLISSIRWNGRFSRDRGRYRLTWMDFPLRHWLLEPIYLRAHVILNLLQCGTDKDIQQCC